MQIIPVIDLYKGLVVQAIAGDRENYKAIDSKICSSANPSDVIDGFLSVFNFKTVYIADLDALECQGDNYEIIKTLCNKYPNTEIWLDCGLSSAGHYLKQAIEINLRFILSSETINSVSIFTDLMNKYSDHRFILSLDFKNNDFLGTHDLFELKNQWPKDVIILNLNSVGTNQGVNYPEEIKSHHLINDFHLYYGGGIRNLDDIQNLSEEGFAGTLISTALHTQMISHNEIKALSQSL